MPNEFQNIQAETLKFVHITDTHLLNKAEETLYSFNTKKHFEAVLTHSQTNYPELDLVLITGDISQTGTKESYTLFKSVLQSFDLPFYCVPGNHDIPKLLQHINPNCPVNSINTIQFGKFSLVLLNSWVQNEHHGMITQSCLQQLENHLQEHEDQFNIIAIHHPPVLINSTWLDEIGLQNKTEFLQLIKKYSHNVLVIFGHVHQEIDQQLDGLRLLSTPSTCHQFKVNSESMHCTHSPPPAYRFIEISKTDNSITKIDTKVHYVG